MGVFELLDKHYNMQQGGQKKPLIVSDKNDPRYKAYQDSLKLFKIGEKDKKQLDKFKDVKTAPFDKRDNLKETDLLAYYRFKETGIKPTKEYVSKGFKNNTESLFAYGYDKPKQSVEIQPKIVDTPQVTPLQQIQTKGLIQSNQEINTPLANITPQGQMPKYWDVIDTNNQRFGGGDTTYRLYPETLNTLRELPQENWTRKVTPTYQQGGEYSENENKFLEELARLKLI